MKCSDLAWDDLITPQVWVDKKNLIEFPLNSVHYLYNYYIVCALLSHTHYVILLMWHFPTLLPCVVSLNKKRIEKEKERNINNDLAILLSHNIK